MPQKLIKSIFIACFILVNFLTNMSKADIFELDKLKNPGITN